MARNRRKQGRRFRRRHAAGRRPRRMRIMANPRQKVYYFRRNVELANYLADADGADSLQQYTFSLQDVPGYSEFQVMFDFYKINAVKVMFIPMFNISPFQAFIGTGPSTNESSFGVAPASNPAALRFFTCVDYNSAPALTVAQIREYSNCKFSTYHRGHRRYIKPKYDLSTRSSSGVQILGKTPWIESSSAGQAHNSIVCGLTTSEFDTTQIAPNDILYKVEAVYYMSFKSTK